MAFTGYAFIIFFFFIVLPLRWLVPSRYAKTVVLMGSVVFYLTWGVKVALLLAVLTLFTYGASLQIRRAGTNKQAVLAVAVTVLLGTLGTFKYAGFFLSLLPGNGHLAAPDLPLPLGISFYVFEMISYLVDVYRGDPGARSFPEFALYVSYFPHLIAGPIVRASELLPQLHEERRFDAERVSEGMFIMLTGFVKKVVLADNLAILADAVFNTPSDYNGLEILAGVAAYTGQIYCDFSGYTDIARGSSAMLGYDLPENFDYPYLSASITEFWRRWHMTLSRWLRDYLYIPLGGSRQGPLAQYRNLFITMALGGLWHGARMTFILWGAYHGLLLALHKLMTGQTKGERWRAVRTTGIYHAGAVVFTLLLVMVGWVFFRASSAEAAASLLKRAVTVMPAPGWKPTRMLTLNSWFLSGVVALHALGASRVGLRAHRGMPAAARGLLWASMVWVCYWLASSSPSFIYFYF